MKICIVNTSTTIPKAEFSSVVKAIQKQVRNDFAPAWGMTATLKQVAAKSKGAQDPDLNVADVIIYVGELGDDPQTVDDALGYHSMNYKGVPYGFVFVDISAQVGEPWSVTLSHEVLELIADPYVNLLVVGPHPRTKNQQALYAYEVCDPVQSDTYAIDGIEVSNFVTPLYFADGELDIVPTTNFQNVSLKRFGVAAGGYLSYFDLKTGAWANVFGRGASKRTKAKARAKNARRMMRHSGKTLK